MKVIRKLNTEVNDDKYNKRRNENRYRETVKEMQPTMSCCFLDYVACDTRQSNGTAHT